MRTSTVLVIGLLLIAALPLLASDGCNEEATPVSTTNVTQATANIQVGDDGLTVEQRNIQQRLETDNSPGSIKHFYIISAWTGQVILYSTVVGKVTSSGKRLSPYSVVALDGQYVDSEHQGIAIDIGDDTHHTTEVLQDDGTFGHSIEYLYWWDQRGAYHQHYVTGGQIPHLSDQPLRVNEIIINIEELAGE